MGKSHFKIFEIVTKVKEYFEVVKKSVKVVGVREIYRRINKDNAITVSIILSLILSTYAEIVTPSENYLVDMKSLIFIHFPKFFLNLTPLILIFRISFLKQIEKRPQLAIGVILYFLLFVPLFLNSERINLDSDLKKLGIFYIGVTICNLLAILMAHVVLLKYTFIDIILRRRRPTGIDPLIVLSTYITLGVSFGFLYSLVTILSNNQAFYNMASSVEIAKSNSTYLRHIYYSFITLVSVGYGDIYPISKMAQLLSIIESLLGIFLLSFSLGVVMNAKLSPEESMEDKGDRSQTLKDMEEIMDRKLKEIKEFYEKKIEAEDKEE